MNMKTLKMSLANIQGKLSRAEMRKVMAGTGVNDGVGAGGCSTSPPCSNSACLLEVVPGGVNKFGTCKSFTFTANGASMTSCMCQ